MLFIIFWMVFNKIVIVGCLPPPPMPSESGLIRAGWLERFLLPPEGGGIISWWQVWGFIHEVSLQVKPLAYSFLFIFNPASRVGRGIASLSPPDFIRGYSYLIRLPGSGERDTCIDHSINSIHLNQLFLLLIITIPGINISKSKNKQSESQY